MRSSRADWLTFLALGLMWGSSYLFIKLAVNDFGTVTLVALRLAIGAALLWAVILRTGQKIPPRGRIYGHLFVMGLINITLPFFLITWAEQRTSSSIAAVLTSLVPLFSSILAPIFIHDEPLRLNAIAGLVVGFVGVIVLTSRELGSASFDLISDLALVGAALSYGAGAVYSRRNVRGLPPMVPAVFQVTFALLVSGIIAVVLERPWDARPSAIAVGSIVWLGLLGSGFAYMAFFRLLAHWGAVRTTLVAYVIPVVGIALGWIVLGEPVDARLLIGSGLVIAGVALVNSRYGRRLIFERARQDATA